MAKIFNKGNLFFWLVIAVGFLAARGLIGSGYFNMHDDLQMMRQLEMEKCFLDLQIPCRWVPDMGYGFGFPLFNFYPPLPYLFGEVFRLLQFTFVDTAKALFVVAFVASGVTMYLFSKEFLGKFGGFVASVFYIWAPYHSVDIYVRGAMNEAWALIWFPAILLGIYKVITVEKEKVSSWVTLLSLFLFALFTSHNLMVMIFFPVATVWGLIWLIKDRDFGRIRNLIIAGFWGFSLAAFFSIPVALESKLVHSDSLVKGYYEYIAHYATINQLLISKFWGYGPSVWLEGDKMAFQIGHIHWMLSAILGLIVIFKLKTERARGAVFYVFAFMLALGWIAAFMTHLRSYPIWSVLPPLKYVQFPWRFLTLVIFGFSFVAGYITVLFSSKIAKVLGVVLVIGVIAYNWNYFKPEYGKLGPLTDEQKFTKAAWDLQQTAGIYDYLPNAAKEAPKAPMKEVAEIMKGEATILDPKLGTSWASFTVNAQTDTEIRLGIFSFPGWKVYEILPRDRDVIPTYVPDTEAWGRMYITLPPGEHKIEARLENTLPRTAGNVVSSLAWIVMMWYLISKWKKSRKNFSR